MVDLRRWLRFHVDGWRELRRCWHRNAQPAHDYIIGLEAALDRVTAQRDDGIKLWNRLEASVTHHKKGKIDEALWTARDKVLRAAASQGYAIHVEAPDGPIEGSHSKGLDSLGQIGNGPIDHASFNSQAEKLSLEPRGQQELSRDTCPVCGTPVKVVSGDEGTSYYEPLGQWADRPI